MNRLRKSLLKALGSKVLDGLRNLGRSGGVRLALGAGVVGLILVLGQGFLDMIERYLQRWGERSRPPWVRSAGYQKVLNAVLEMVV